ncbi:ATP synthase subunit I [Pelotomaculum isophthalicicum JI]|uniref:ATP synthase subunit I n=1 Tax=Pelotomaculum isophthalicicum JI TaxID=947010 RepID=A0A9X4H4X3_9FIRM|nr:ATP synthase subunit I [Pelotomaculum isophthalicicum]MDF9407628.1 ATP synthase subunit I [Pelotomaculum isophthalicicum JI]
MRDWDFAGQLARTLRISGFLLAFYCLLLLLQPGNPVVWGLLVGTATGMWNAFFLSKRLHAAVKAGLPRAGSQVMAGVFLRLVIIMVVLYFVSRTGFANIYAAAAGIFVVSCIFTFSVAGNLLKEASLAGSLRYKSVTTRGPGVRSQESE